MKRYPQHVQMRRAIKAKCPACARDTAWYGEVTVDAGTCFQRAGCFDCLSEWSECYTLTSIQDLDQDTKALAEAQAESVVAQ